MLPLLNLTRVNMDRSIVRPKPLVRTSCIVVQSGIESTMVVQILERSIRQSLIC